MTIILTLGLTIYQRSIDLSVAIYYKISILEGIDEDVTNDYYKGFKESQILSATLENKDYWFSKEEENEVNLSPY